MPELNTTAIHEQIGEFYNKSIVAKFWEIRKKQEMHVGYWDEQHPFRNDLWEGAQRMTQLMISQADVGEDQLFIDIGCGFGIPAIKLAGKKKCMVTGITASKYQADMANNNALINHMSAWVVFMTGNACNLPVNDAFFDAGWFFESIFHIGHDTALQEAYRVLKSGASLLIADFMQIDDFGKSDMVFLKNEAGIKSTCTMDEYPVLLEKNGFDLIELRDITKNTIDKEKRWEVHRDIIDKEKDELLKSMDQNEYGYLHYFFEQLNKIARKSIGYCLVKAKKQ